MIYSDEKEDQLPGNRGAPDGKCCVARERNENEECQIYAAERRWGLRSVQTCGGGQKSGWGVRSAERINGARIQLEEHRWDLRSALPSEEHQNGGGWVRTA